MAAAVPALVIASAAISAAGAIKMSQAQATAARYNAQVNEQNAQIAEAQGAAAAEAQSREAQRRIGAAVAQYGAAGVDLSTGSPADVLAESVRNATLDNLTLKYNYKLRALGFRNQANLDYMSADASRQAGYFSAAGALVGGAAKVYGGYGGGSSPTFG